MCALGRKERIENFLPALPPAFPFRYQQTATAVVQLALTAIESLPPVGHRVDRVHDQVNEHFAQLGGTAESMLPAFSFKRHFIVQTAQPRFVLPTRTRDLDCVVQQAATSSISNSFAGDLRAKFECGAQWQQRLPQPFE